MQTVIIIPARMGSSRFPGKPLAKIAGKSMLHRIIENALAVPAKPHVVVATCDEEIREEANQFPGVDVIMTSDKHSRASERTFEALTILESRGLEFQLVIMLQGDEPCITPDMIDRQISACTENPDWAVTNLVGPIASREEFLSPNTIKCAVTSESEITFFSRAPILGDHAVGKRALGRQICSISFSRQALETFESLGESSFEELESIDMLRLVENKFAVHAIWVEERTHPVDVLSDIAIVERILENLVEPGL